MAISVKSGWLSGARGQQRKQIALFVGVVQRAGHVKIAQHAFQRGDHHRVTPCSAR